jgi:hypothetical protein
MDAFKAVTPLYGLWSILEGGEFFIPRVHGGNTWCMLENVLKIECCKTEATEIKKSFAFLEILGKVNVYDCSFSIKLLLIK